MRSLLWPSLLCYAVLGLLRRDDLLQVAGRFVLRPYTLWLTSCAPGLVDFMLGPWGYAGDAALLALLLAFAGTRRGQQGGERSSDWRVAALIVGGVGLAHWLVLGWVWFRCRE
jgi:hypothetical protein